MNNGHIQKDTKKHERIHWLDLFFHVRYSQKNGFTLVELVVVLLVISMLLAVSVPVFRQDGLFFERPGGVPSLVRLIGSLKARAVRENLDIFLHVSPGTDRMWVTDSSMDTRAAVRAADTYLKLPDSLHIAGVELAHDYLGPQTGQTDPGAGRKIRFSRHGYCDAAIVRLAVGNTLVSLKIEPFIAQTQTIFNRISFNDCLSAW